ncbi:MAG: metallophosphoesterase [Microscillaceae bacterium]|nr:metallophosphoesterase [Microscillaceae bacterium]
MLAFKIAKTVLILMIDWYFFQALLVVFKDKLSTQSWRLLSIIFWSITAVLLSYSWMDKFVEGHFLGTSTRQFFMRTTFIMYISKLLGAGLLMMEDIVFQIQKLLQYLSQKPQQALDSPAGESKMTRSEFLSKTALISGVIPLSLTGYGVLREAHDYQVRRQPLYLPNLPKSFEGLTIGQISDIHSGSFFNPVAVKGGVEMLLREKPDLIFFTGDLVNYEADEIKEYFDIFKKVKAPLGVYSVLGNHDYGEYKSWMDARLKAKNLEKMLLAHKELGWDLLQDENRTIRQGSDQIAVLGVGNWGIRGRSNRHGKIEKAYSSTEESPVKLLLSHDPSHWKAQITGKYADIDVTFSGHTHGMQIGFDMLGIQWSPIQFVYEEWAGLYQDQNQYLYVNRGFGYADIFPCRIGMPPEITIFELKRGEV